MRFLKIYHYYNNNLLINKINYINNQQIINNILKIYKLLIIINNLIFNNYQMLKFQNKYKKMLFNTLLNYKNNIKMHKNKLINYKFKFNN